MIVVKDLTDVGSGKTRESFLVLPEEGINHPSEGVSSLALEGPSRGCGTPSAGVIMKVVCT